MDNFKEKYKALHGAMLAARDKHVAAQMALDAAMDAANEAEEKMLDAGGEFKTFMAAQAKALREKLLDSEIFNAKLQLTTQSGDTVTTDLSQIWIGARCVVNSAKEGFRISVDAGDNHPERYVTLGIYETPDEVEAVIGSLREAIRRGDKAFTFGGVSND